MTIFQTSALRIVRQKARTLRNSPANFFMRRGELDLTRDSAAHRRYHWLYEDMLS